MDSESIVELVAFVIAVSHFVPFLVQLVKVLLELDCDANLKGGRIGRSVELLDEITLVTHDCALPPSKTSVGSQESAERCRVQSSDMFEHLRKEQTYISHRNRGFRWLHEIWYKTGKRPSRLKGLAREYKKLKVLLSKETWNISVQIFHQQQMQASQINEIRGILLEKVQSTMTITMYALANLTAMIYQTKREMSHEIDRFHRSAKLQAQETRLLRTNTESRDKVSELRIKRYRFMESLQYSQMGERRCDITEQSPQTLSWILPSSKQSTQDETLATNNNFRAWLCRESPIYWVRGKLGSGKSTLMAHLSSCSELEECARYWTGGRKLCVLSFFFWRAGHQIGRSRQGLLRTLLYQVCGFDANIVDQLIQAFMPTETSPDWTTALLEKAFLQAILSAPETRFCVFIDGLDECSQTSTSTERFCDNTIADLVLSWTSFKNAKFCVSSRPEVKLMRRLEGFPQMKLEDHNFGDILKFTKSRLLGAATSIDLFEQESFHEEIAVKAEGVFLWAVFMTDALIQGAVSGDSDFLLKQRLATMPRDMNSVYKLMTRNIDPLHKPTLSFYLKTAELSSRTDPLSRLTTIPVLTAARINRPIHDLNEFLRECNRTEIQIAAQSAGLLEVRPSQEIVITSASWKSGHSWFESEHNTTNSAPTKLPTSGLKRSRRASAETYPEVLRYETRHIKWVHRSAYDFFRDPKNADLLDLVSVGYSQALQRIFSGFLRYYVVAPSCNVKLGTQELTMTARRRNNMIYASAYCWQDAPKVVEEAAERLAQSSKNMELGEQNWDQILPPHDHMWLEYGRHQLWDYIYQRKDDISLNILGSLMNMIFNNGPGQPIKYEAGVRIASWLQEKTRQRSAMSRADAKYSRDVPRLLCRLDDQLLATISYTPSSSCMEDSDAVGVSLAMRRLWDRREDLKNLNLPCEGGDWMSSNEQEPSGLNGATKDFYSRLHTISDKLDLHLEVANYERRICLQIPASALSIYACKDPWGKYDCLLAENSGKGRPRVRLAFILDDQQNQSSRPALGLKDQFHTLDRFVTIDLNNHTSRKILHYLAFGQDFNAEYPEPTSLAPVLCATNEQLTELVETCRADLQDQTASLPMPNLKLISPIMDSCFRPMLDSIWALANVEP